MKKNYILLLLLCLCFAGCKEKTVVESDYLPIADPYVMLYEGKYYAYGTGGTVEGEGFACFSSDDLKNWTREGQALSAADSYGTWGFWAPEVYYIESKKKFYLFYSTEEHICVATADVPQGPFRQEVSSRYGMRRVSIPLYSLMMTVRLTFISCVLQMATSSGWQR